MRFIHAADIHLDSALHGLERYDGAPVDEIRSATRRAFDNLIELAIDEEVDFVLLAGDIYDGDWKDYNIATVNVLSDPSLYEVDLYARNTKHNLYLMLRRHLIWEVFRVWQPVMNLIVRWAGARDPDELDELDGSCPTEKLNKDHENGANVVPAN